MNASWNWQRKDWPFFRYQSNQLIELENDFLIKTGIFLGIYKHVTKGEREQLIVDVLCDEAYETSAIEGELLDRDSLQASVRRHLGLDTKKHLIKPNEKGIVDLVLEVSKHYQEDLSNEILFDWHSLLMQGRTDLQSVGAYRKHQDAMQIVSGPIHKPQVHFEAPPSHLIYKEMTRFIKWFNDTAPNGQHPLPALQRASMAHLYFESIHPFEDGNGRIGRVLVEKALSQSLKEPIVLALSLLINQSRKKYYEMLAENSIHLEIDSWMQFFSKTILDAQSYTINMVECLMEKTRFYDRFESELNQRQLKALARIFKEGLKGFEGGFSHANYVNTTGASRATATRDLQDLVAKGVFDKTGVGKGTRYFMRIKGTG